jgi:DNA repair photolyase
MDLFSEFDEPKKNSIGNCKVIYKHASSILTEGKGFMDGYDYTLNPYSGCSFGCTYCYAAFFSRFEDLSSNWGYWVQVKENALHLLTKYRKKNLKDKTIYMSSVTDPYQPIEKNIQLTRSLIKELLDYHQPRLVIQTRSALVTRDIDILKEFKVLQVNMTITTDSEKVRKIFEPICPSNSDRMKAIKEINDSGINTCITMTPLLPIENPEVFAQKLLDTGVKKFVIQPFHSDKGKFIAGTRQSALDLIKEMDWSDDKYLRVVEIIQKYIPDIGIGKEGFKAI